MERESQLLECGGERELGALGVGRKRKELCLVRVVPPGRGRGGAYPGVEGVEGGMLAREVERLLPGVWLAESGMQGGACSFLAGIANRGAGDVRTPGRDRGGEPSAWVCGMSETWEGAEPRAECAGGVSRRRPGGLIGPSEEGRGEAGWEQKMFGSDGVIL